MTVITEADERIARTDPTNTLEMRSLRMLNHEIAELERKLQTLRFIRDTLERHS